MELNVPMSEVAIREDPFMILGYGINAYFEIINSLFWMMLFVTFAFLPILSVYSSNPINALASRPKAFFNMWTLGNYGASSVKCK